MRLGNPAIEILSNCKELQFQWARENDVDISDQDWQTTVALAQLKQFQPEVVYFQDIFSLPENVRRAIKELVPSIWLAIIQKGFPGERRSLDDADLLLVSSPVLMDRYRHLKPHLIYHSFDQELLNHISTREDSKHKSHNFIFTGSTRTPELRYWMLRKLLSEEVLAAWIQEDGVRHQKLGGVLQKKYLRKKLAQTIELLLLRRPKNDVILANYVNPEWAKSNFDPDKADVQLANRSRFGRIPRNTLMEEFSKQVRHPVFGLEYFKLMSDAKIVFNLHADSAGFTVDNMKMFESTGVGACLLTDSGCNLANLFEVDHEVVTYSSMGELHSKVSYLLDNEEARVQIAAAGRKRTLRDHTLRNRCEQIADLIRSVR